MTFTLSLKAIDSSRQWSSVACPKVIVKSYNPTLITFAALVYIGIQ